MALAGASLLLLSMALGYGLASAASSWSSSSSSSSSFWARDSRPPGVNPCPRGCTCSVTPTLPRHNHWHRLLAMYRSRGRRRARASSPLQGADVRDYDVAPYAAGGPAGLAGAAGADPAEQGRDMTCVGLQNMPAYVPQDISKMSLLGDATRKRYSEAGLGDGFGNPNNNNYYSQVRRTIFYSQLTYISQHAFRQSASLHELSIEGNRIRVLHPNDFQWLTSLRRLRLYDNRIKVVEAGSFKGLVALKELDVSQNHIKKIDKTLFYDVSDLKSLKLQRNRIRGLNRKTFKLLKYLEELDISDNFIRDLHKGMFFNNDNLRVLKMDYNRLKVIRSDWFVNLYNLEKLSLKANRIVQLSHARMTPLTNLKHLDLSLNEVKTLAPGAFDGVDSLQTLLLQENNITELGEGVFANLVYLETLSLSDNDIDTLHNDTFRGLENLKKLELANNELVVLPHAALALFANLQELDLSNNHLKRIASRNFYGLANLRELRLEHNRIRVIEDEGFAVSVMNAYTKLTWLYLNHNQLDAVTQHMLHGLSFLKFLNLGQNAISVIEDGAFSMLKRLHSLIVSHNKLASVDASTFQHLKYLYHLNLASNNLRKLVPGVFRGLERLEDMNLQDNSLEAFPPDSFRDSPKMNALYVKKNKLRSVDLALLDTIPRLKYLDLSKNYIGKVFMPRAYLKNLFFLSLADNDIEKLSSDVSGIMTSSGSLHLYGNPWSCDCDLKWLPPLVNNAKIHLAGSGDIICKTPHHFSGEKILALKPDDFRCTVMASHKSRFRNNAAVLADEPRSDDEHAQCSFLPHARRELTRTDVKTSKGDVFKWMATIYDDKDGLLCDAIQLSRGRLLTPSTCWKEVHVGSQIFVRFGANSTDKKSKYQSTLAEVVNFPGSVDISVVKVEISDEISESLQRVFPCVLSASGLMVARVDGAFGALITRERDHVGDKTRSLKYRGITFKTTGKTRTCDDRAYDTLCIRKSSRHKLDDSSHKWAPYFVKVGRSKWALAGVATAHARLPRNSQELKIHTLSNGIS